MFSHRQLLDLYLKKLGTFGLMQYYCKHSETDCCDIMSMNCDIKNSEVLSILDRELGLINATRSTVQLTSGEQKKLKISWNS